MRPSRDPARIVRAGVRPPARVVIGVAPARPRQAELGATSAPADRLAHGDLGPDDILELQRLAGNEAAAGLLVQRQEAGERRRLRRGRARAADGRGRRAGDQRGRGCGQRRRRCAARVARAPRRARHRGDVRPVRRGPGPEAVPGAAPPLGDGRTRERRTPWAWRRPRRHGSATSAPGRSTFDQTPATRALRTTRASPDSPAASRTASRPRRRPRTPDGRSSTRSRAGSGRRSCPRPRSTRSARSPRATATRPPTSRPASRSSAR